VIAFEWFPNTLWICKVEYEPGDRLFPRGEPAHQTNPPFQVSYGSPSILYQEEEQFPLVGPRLPSTQFHDSQELKDEATQMTPSGDQLRDVVRLLNYYKEMCMPKVS